MNRAKYKLPQKVDRDKVSQKKFCNDCKENKKDCKKEIRDCIKEATLYEKFIKIRKDYDN